jgi:hypothetical protein
LPAPVINPLRILYLLNHHPIDSGHAFSIYMTFVSSVIIVLILWNNALVRRYIDKQVSQVQE